MQDIIHLNTTTLGVPLGVLVAGLMSLSYRDSRALQSFNLDLSQQMAEILRTKFWRERR